MSMFPFRKLRKCTAVTKLHNVPCLVIMGLKIYWYPVIKQICSKFGTSSWKKICAL